MTQEMERFLDWCRKEREKAQESIEFWSAPGAKFAGEFGGEVRDITASHIDHLHGVVANMTRLIAKIEADAQGS